MFKRLRSRIRAFAGDTSGSAVTIEVCFWLPLILVLIAATFSLHGAFRHKSLNTKAAYVISDAISRETEAIDAEYIDGMVDLLRFLTRSKADYSLRVTLVNFDGDEYDANGHLTKAGNGYEIEWSQTRGDFLDIDSAIFTEMKKKLPTMLDNERLIVVETQTDYRTTFNVLGTLNNTEMFYTFGFTRPRFAPKIVWKDT